MVQAPSTPAVSETLKELEAAPNYREWLRELVAPHIGSRVLDVGSGTGYVTEAFCPRELVVALEPMPEYAPQLRERFSARPEVKVMTADMTDPAVVSELREMRLDSAMSFNVFEHIEDDAQALRNVHAVLEPGAVLALFVPASMKIYGPLDSSLGHWRRYTRRELTAKAAAAGFEVVAVRHVNLPGFFAWFITARLHRGGGFPGGAGSISLYDRVVIPVIRVVERHLPVPFGQSLLLVARKPASGKQG